MLFHLLRYDDRHGHKSHNHQKQKIALTDKHKVALNVVSYAQERVRIFMQVEAIILAKLCDVSGYVVVQVVTCVYCTFSIVLVQEVLDLVH